MRLKNWLRPKGRRFSRPRTTRLDRECQIKKHLSRKVAAAIQRMGAMIPIPNTPRLKFNHRLKTTCSPKEHPTRFQRRTNSFSTTKRLEGLAKAFQITLKSSAPRKQPNSKSGPLSKTRWWGIHCLSTLPVFHRWPRNPIPILLTFKFKVLSSR